MDNYWMDIDGVIADFCAHVINYLGLPDHPFTEWNDNRIRDNWHLIADDLVFWQTIPAMNRDIPFEITGYITSRPISSEESVKWLSANGFPKAEVITIPPMGSKGEVLRDKHNAVLIDDGGHNYEDCVKHGVRCYLFDTPYNRHIDTDMRIYNLSEIPLSLHIN